MQNTFIDLTGKKIGNLIVLRKINFDNCSKWECRCFCGKMVLRTTSGLRKSNKKNFIKSCGCLNKNNIKGKRFGKLKAVQFIKNIKRGSVWLFKCDCGTEKEIVYTDVMRKRRPVTSCGCNKNVVRQQSKVFKGTGELGLFYVNSLRIRAKERGLLFDVDTGYLWDLFLKQKRKCAISGQELFMNTSTRIRDGNASLDRIDSTKGYIVGNVQWIHKHINVMKWDLEQSYFIEMCKIIAYNNQEKK